MRHDRIDAERRGLLHRLTTDRKLRWGIYLVGLVVLGLLCFFPRPYVARAKILPQENGSAAGLGSMVDVLGGSLGSAAFLSKGSSTEAYLVIGRSNEVGLDVIRRLKLVGPGRKYATVNKALRALDRKVDIHALLGGTLEVEVFSRSPDEAMQLSNAFLHAVNDRIGSLSQHQIGMKRNLVRARFSEATLRLARAEAALAAFRERYHLADPNSLFGAAVSQRAGLEGQLQAKLVELQAARQFVSDQNNRIQVILSEIAALRTQIAQSNRPTGDGATLNLAAQTKLTNEYMNLYRDYTFAQGLYGVYSRFSEQVELQELAAASNSDIQIVEEAHLDPARHFNVLAVALFAFWVTLILFLELYAPATGMHLPVREPVAAE